MMHSEKTSQDFIKQLLEMSFIWEMFAIVWGYDSLGDICPKDLTSAHICVCENNYINSGMNQFNENYMYNATRDALISRLDEWRAPPHSLRVKDVCIDFFESITINITQKVITPFCRVLPGIDGAGNATTKTFQCKKLNWQIISNHILQSPKYLKYHSRLLKSLVQTEILNSNLINQRL